MPSRDFSSRCISPLFISLPEIHILLSNWPVSQDCLGLILYESNQNALASPQCKYLYPAFSNKYFRGPPSAMVPELLEGQIFCTQSICVLLISNLFLALSSVSFALAICDSVLCSRTSAPHSSIYFWILASPHLSLCCSCDCFSCVVLEQTECFKSIFRIVLVRIHHRQKSTIFAWQHYMCVFPE